MAKRNPAHLKIVRKKGPELPEIKHSILTRKNVSARGLDRYRKGLLAALSPHLLPEAMMCLRKAMSEGEIKAAETILKAFEVLKAPGINVNQNNHNTVAQTEMVGGFRNFDTFIRDRAISKGMVLDIKPAIEEAEKVLEEAGPSGPSSEDDFED